jgi:hypothetical protein
MFKHEIILTEVTYEIKVFTGNVFGAGISWIRNFLLYILIQSKENRDVLISLLFTPLNPL